MVQTVKNHLLDVGCSEKAAEDVDRLCTGGKLDDALQWRIPVKKGGTNHDESRRTETHPGMGQDFPEKR